MNIVVRTPLMQDKIKDLLDGGTFDGVSFSFVEKKGIELTFSVSGDDPGSLDIISIVKSAVKESDFGKGIMFSVLLK